MEIPPPKTAMCFLAAVPVSPEEPQTQKNRSVLPTDPLLRADFA